MYLLTKVQEGHLSRLGLIYSKDGSSSEYVPWRLVEYLKQINDVFSYFGAPIMYIYHQNHGREDKLVSWPHRNTERTVNLSHDRKHTTVPLHDRGVNVNRKVLLERRRENVREGQ